jgi:UDP-4-amino-4,6-dideoxy-N-acetyl-beta-L-altrosamine transaminase
MKNPSIKVNRFLPYSRQNIDERDIEEVCRVLKEDFITQGPRIERFEKKFAEYVGTKFAVACATGTAALHLSCQALKLGPGKNLITSPITFIASANCAQFVGADTCFADIDLKDHCISAEALEKELKNKKIDIVVVVHMSGHPANLEAIFELKKKFDFKIIEDSCHALGGYYKKKKIGSCAYSDISTFSFHPVKAITTGEGGMITTNNKEIYDSLLKLRTHGIHKNVNFFINKEMAFDNNKNANVWYYEMTELGLNYRITDIQSALGESQLKKIDQFIDMRRKIAKIYNMGFAKNDLITTPAESSNVIHAYHLYTILIDFEKLSKTRNQVMQELKAENIGTQVLYIPVHLQPYYSKKYGFKKGDFPIAEKYYQNCLSIPIFPHLKESEVNHVIDKINLIISKKGFNKVAKN